MIKAVVFAGCITLAWWSSGCQSGSRAQHYHAHFIELTPPSGPCDVSLSTGYGSISVSKPNTVLPGWAEMHLDGKRLHGSILVGIAMSSDRTRAAAVEFEPDWNDGELTIVEHWPGGGGAKNGEGVGYVVQLPEIRDVSLSTRFGDLGVSSASGNLLAESGFGDIYASSGESASADLRTGYGKIVARTIRGPVVAVTRQGTITVSDISGPVTARTDFGDVNGDRLGGTIDAETRQGEVELALTDENPGPFRAVSRYGNIYVAIGPGFTGSIRMGSEYGDLRRILRTRSGRQTERAPGSQSETTVTFGDGKPSLAWTSYGDVQVYIKAEDTP